MHGWKIKKPIFQKLELNYLISVKTYCNRKLNGKFEKKKKNYWVMLNWNLNKSR